MKGYKAFEKGLICRGKQYAENTVFEEEKAEICRSGMHFCERPLDVLKFYPPCNENGELNEFCEVEALDEALTDDNIKYCTKKLKIGAKIGIVGLINAEVEYIKKQIADMLVQSINFTLGKFIVQIVVMNTENAFIISIVNMYLQALALLSAMIPSGFNIFACNGGVLVADHHVIELFSEVILFTD